MSIEKAIQNETAHAHTMKWPAINKLTLVQCRVLCMAIDEITLAGPSYFLQTQMDKCAVRDSIQIHSTGTLVFLLTTCHLAASAHLPSC